MFRLFWLSTFDNQLIADHFYAMAKNLAPTRTGSKRLVAPKRRRNIGGGLRPLTTKVEAVKVAKSYAFKDHGIREWRHGVARTDRNEDDEGKVFRHWAGEHLGYRRWKGKNVLNLAPSGFKDRGKIVRAMKGLLSDHMEALVAKVDKDGNFVIVGQMSGKAETQSDVLPEPADVAFKPDARARAILRGVSQREADLAAAGGAYELTEVQALLHDVSVQAVTKRVREGSLLAVPGPGGQRRYPTAQFLADGRVVPDLKKVIAAFPSRSPWMLLNFLVQPDPRLEQRKPIDLLKAGNLNLVLEAAHRVGLQGG